MSDRPHVTVYHFGRHLKCLGTMDFLFSEDEIIRRGGVIELYNEPQLAAVYLSDHPLASEMTPDMFSLKFLFNHKGQILKPLVAFVIEGNWKGPFR